MITNKSTNFSFGLLFALFIIQIGAAQAEVIEHRLCYFATKYYYDRFKGHIVEYKVTQNANEGPQLFLSLIGNAKDPNNIGKGLKSIISSSFDSKTNVLDSAVIKGTIWIPHKMRQCLATRKWQITTLHPFEIANAPIRYFRMDSKTKGITRTPVYIMCFDNETLKKRRDANLLDLAGAGEKPQVIIDIDKLINEGDNDDAGLDACLNVGQAGTGASTGLDRAWTEAEPGDLDYKPKLNPDTSNQ